MRLGFYLNADECIGCKTCVMACKDVHNLPVGVSYRRVYNLAGGSWDENENHVPVPKGIYSYSISISCNHCKEPSCIPVCPQNAIRKEKSGLVWIDAGKCVGCRLCASNCPHGAIQFNRQRGVSEKCNMCMELLELRKEPACVAACPMRCLKIIDMDKFHSDIEGMTTNFPVGSITQPSFQLHLNRKVDLMAEEINIRNMVEEL